MNERPPHFGYPKFWPTARKEFAGFFEIVPRLNEAATYFITTDFEQQEPHQVVIRHGVAIGIACLFELVTLVGNGLGTGAWKVTRALVELTINLEYLRKFDDERTAYIDWHWVERHRTRAFFR